MARSRGLGDVYKRQALGYASLSKRVSGQLAISKNGVRVYPVPSQGLGWTVSSLDKFTAVSIHNLAGKLLGEMVFESPVSRCEIVAPTLSQPLYLLTVKLADGSTQTRLIK
jgi:hypothetical protein